MSRTSAATSENPSPLFIIGAPRTGSTILYQAVTNWFDVLYIDNLACRWSGDLNVAIARSRKRFGDHPHESFHSHFGDTRHEGLHAPSECGEFWYRWVRKGQHSVTGPEVEEKASRQIRHEISAVSARWHLPIVFKNLNMGQRLPLVADALPSARLLVIDRDDRAIVRSILAARRFHGVGPNEWWGTRPLDWENHRHLVEQEMVAWQVSAIRSRIDADLALFPARNIMRVTFEDLSSDTVLAVGAWAGLRRRPSGSMPTFETS